MTRHGSAGKLIEMDYVTLSDGSVELNEFDLYALRTIVEENGGAWVGVQQGLSVDGEMLSEPLALFNDASGRHGSTMALKVSQCTAATGA